MSWDKLAVDEEIGARSARLRDQAGPSQMTAEYVTWLACIVAKVTAVLVVILDIAFNEVVDWLLLLFYIPFLSLLVIRAAPPRTESFGLFGLGFIGVMLHVSTAAGGSGLAIFACKIHAWMIAFGIARAAVILYFQGFGQVKDWMFCVPPYMQTCVARLEVCMHNACNNRIFMSCMFVSRVLITFAFGLVLLGFLAVSVLLYSTDDLAAVGTYDATMVVPAAAIAAGRAPPMELGTAENINLGPIPIDITGIWWIRWNQGEPMPLYSRMHVEETVTLAGAYINETIADSAPISYPVRAYAPNRDAHHWGFSNSLVSRIGMMTISQSDLSQKMTIDIHSPSRMDIHGGGETPWSGHKLNEDEWLRRIEIQGSPDLSYTLTRIVYGNGTAHPVFYDAFLRHMGGTKLRVWTSDDTPCRECGSRPAGTASRCEDVCVAPPA